MPCVSVIVPTYNRAHFVIEAVQSVLNQSFVDLEVIVIDDGSNDNTRTLIEGIQDQRIHYIYQENAGLAAARNTGIRHARSDLLAFLDDDDLFFPEKLAIQVEAIENNPEIGLLSGGWQYINLQGTIIKENRPWYSYPILNLETWLGACPVIVNAVLVRRNWIEQCGGFDESLRQSEDWDLWLRLANAGCKMDWTKEIVCVYRIHSSNMVHNAAKQRYYLLKVLDKFFNQVELSSDLVALRSHAYSKAFIRGAARLYVADLPEAAAVDIEQAIKYNPSLVDGKGDSLFFPLVGWANDPIVNDPYEYIARIFNNLPPSANRLKTRKKEAYALVAKNQLFDAYRQNDWGEIRRCLIKIANLSPGMLRDKGIVSVILQMVIGRQVFHRIKRILQNPR